LSQARPSGETNNAEIAEASCGVQGPSGYSPQAKTIGLHGEKTLGFLQRG